MSSRTRRSNSVGGAGAAGGAGGNVLLTPAMLQNLLTQLGNANAAPRNTRNNAAPDYTVPPEFDAANNVNPDGRKFKQGNDEKVTQQQWKDLMTDVLELSNADVHALRAEGIKYPWDFAKLDDETMLSLLSNLKKSGYPLKAHSQKMVRSFRDFAEFLLKNSYEIRGEHFTKDAIVCCAVQYKALKESKDSKDSPAKLAKLLDNTDPLAWIESSHKTFKHLVGTDYIPLGYVIRKDVQVDKDPRDHPILDKKCFSERYGSLRNELIARRTHNDGVYDSNNEIVYNFLREAFKRTKHSSILKGFEKTSDGRGVWMRFLSNHGGESRWETSYEKLVTALTRK